MLVFIANYNYEDYMLYESKEYLEKRFTEVEDWFNKEINIIDNIPDNYLKFISYFALIECFAQEYAGYNGYKNADDFCKFVYKFQTSYSFLCEHDPITLFFEYKSLLSTKFNLDFLEDEGTCSIKTVKEFIDVKEIVHYLKSNGTSEREISKFNYAKLLYKMRSKLSHEFIFSNAGINYHLLERYPYYACCTIVIISNDTTESKDVWELIFPLGFVKALCLECINNYLKYTKEKHLDPFSNKDINKPWYK